MQHDFVIYGEKVILKPLLLEDAEAYRLLRNRYKDCFISKIEISAEAQKQWYEKYLTKDNDIMFKIVAKSNPGDSIGAIALYDIDKEKRTAEFGRVIIDKEKVSEKGLGTDAITAICIFGFEKFSLNSIVATVLKNNLRVKQLYERLGFMQVGEDDIMYVLELKR